MYVGFSFNAIISVQGESSKSEIFVTFFFSYRKFVFLNKQWIPSACLKFSVES